MFFRKRTNHNRELFKLIVLVVTFLIGLLLGYVRIIGVNSK